MARRILTEFVMDKIAAVDKPCQEHATVTIMKRDFSAKDRKEDAKSGAAMPGGGFPIENTNDLHNAVRAVGRAKNPAAAKAHIRQRAKTLGVDDPFGKSFSSDDAAMNAFKKLAMLRTNVLKAKANEMLESQEDCGGGKMPRRGPVKRNSQPMTKAWSDAAREAAAAAKAHNKAAAKADETLHPRTGDSKLRQLHEQAAFHHETAARHYQSGNAKRGDLHVGYAKEREQQISNYLKNKN